MNKLNESSVSSCLTRTGRFAAKHPQLLRRLGHIETCWFSDRLESIQIDRPIYITGLARSGSTLLLELLTQHEQTATHQYIDFPFVHLPLWWNWFMHRASRKNSTPVERFHRDRILVTPHSPEAMEEILWMTFFKELHNPHKNNELTEATEHSGFATFYHDHIEKLLLLRKGSRYVAKNNYNISRLRYLQHLHPDALFIIPVREPTEHIGSLMKQQRLLLSEESEDPRVLNYMRQAGHFEFGADRRPINTGDTAACEDILSSWARGDEVRGWAKSWASLYRYVADQLEKNDRLRKGTLVVHYEDLCSSPEQTLIRLHEHCELEYRQETIAKQAKGISKPTYYTLELSETQRATIEQQCKETHQKMLSLCKEYT